jgi:hypothetical protein
MEINDELLIAEAQALCATFSDEKKTCRCGCVCNHELNSVREIDGVEVSDVSICMNSLRRVFLEIDMFGSYASHMTKIRFDIKEHIDEITPEICAEILRAAAAILENLVYDKLQDYLTPRKNMRRQCFMNFHFAGKNIGKCAVCLDYTTSKTCCKHLLCKKCRFSLVKLECPICRHKFPFSDCNDCEEHGIGCDSDIDEE